MNSMHRGGPPSAPTAPQAEQVFRRDLAALSTLAAAAVPNRHADPGAVRSARGALAAHLDLLNRRLAQGPDDLIRRTRDHVTALLRQYPEAFAQVEAPLQAALARLYAPRPSYDVPFPLPAPVGLLSPPSARGLQGGLAAPTAPSASSSGTHAPPQPVGEWNPLANAWEKAALPESDLVKHGLGYLRASSVPGGAPEWVPVPIARVDMGHGDYLLMTKNIGHGRFGAVHLAIRRDGTVCAVKTSRLDAKRDAYNEIVIAKTDVTVLEGFVAEARIDRSVEGADKVDAGVVSKRFRKGLEVRPLGLDYLDAWNGLPDATPWFDVARIVLQQTSESVARLHANGHLHLDCKPDNVILIDGKANMLDRGLVAPLGADGTVALEFPRGTLGYEAPEVMFEGTCRPSTDTWGLAQLALRSVALTTNPFYPPPTADWLDRVALRDRTGATLHGDGGFPVCDETRLLPPHNAHADVYDSYMARLRSESPDRYRGILNGDLRLQEEWSKDILADFEVWHARLWKVDASGTPGVD
ncbi:MAG TPA: hypothetical protein VFH51_20285, partial [Myxococcota bacterium]|nr:hypothetical protein [Myxococcota bacterium]